MVTITLKQRHRYHRERCCSRKSITKTALVIAVFVGCLLLKTVMDSNNNNQQDGNYYDLIGITVQPVKVVSKYATVKNTKHNLAEVEIFSTTTGIPITQSHITATAAATAATAATTTATPSIATTMTSIDGGTQTQITTTTPPQEESPNTILFSKTKFQNSRRWLQGPRYRNFHEDSGINHNDYIQHNVLSLPHLLNNDTVIQQLFQQTLAVNDSHFLTFHDYNISNNHPTDAKEIHLWTLRLLYLVLHVHQHMPALAEAQERQKKKQQQQQHHHRNSKDGIFSQFQDVGSFDYECGGTGGSKTSSTTTSNSPQYLLANVQNFGIGADVYWSFVPAYKAGLAVNRIVHFVHQYLPASHTNDNDNAKELVVVPEKYRTGWTQASCRRKDYQCIFAPSSPCVPTLDDIEQGYVLNKIELRDLFLKGTLPTKVQNTTVVFMVADEDDIVWVPNKRLAGKTEQATKRILNNLIATTLSKDDPRLPMFRKVQFGPALSQRESMLHAFAYYALRPRPDQAQRIETYLHDSLPENFNPRYTVGLPVRASDKCKEESECLTFVQHMEVVQAEWKKLYRSKNINKNMSSTTAEATTALPAQPQSIIFTTESKDMFQEQTVYQHQHQHELNTTFIINKHDVMPNTGYYQGDQADDILLSALTTLKLQLYSRLTVANCCSNFARTIRYFTQGGLGVALSRQDQPHLFRCLQDVDDPRYHLCCWKENECLQKKQEAIQLYLQNK